MACEGAVGGLREGEDMLIILVQRYKRSTVATQTDRSTHHVYHVNERHGSHATAIWGGHSPSSRFSRLCRFERLWLE